MTTPNYPYTTEIEGTIRDRMLGKISPDWDKREGSFIWDSLAPDAIELALSYIRAAQVFEWHFVANAFGSYLDEKAIERGLTRIAAIKAIGTQRFNGTNGTSIPLGTQVSTEVVLGSGEIPIVFQTTVAGAIGVSGYVDLPIEAIVAGNAGNIPTGALKILLNPIVGITSTSNPSDTTKGADAESDTSLRLRVQQKMQHPGTSGNKANYRDWVQEVNPLYKCYVQPVWDGNGTVKVWVVNDLGSPADSTQLDALRTYIAPLVNLGPYEAEGLTITGFGVSIDTTQIDDSGNSMKMVYNVSGAGKVKDYNLVSHLSGYAGIWRIYTKLKVDSIAGASQVLTIGVWNSTLNAWAKTDKTGAADATLNLYPNNLSITFIEKDFKFYWNGQDALALLVTREITDTTTTVWYDSYRIASTFSSPLGDGKAPIGAAVTIDAASAKPIPISATLVLKNGYTLAGVTTDFASRYTAYFQGIAMDLNDNDVKYVKVGNLLYETPGISDYSNLLVNGGTANVVVQPYEVATAGTITFS